MITTVHPTSGADVWIHKANIDTKVKILFAPGKTISMNLISMDGFINQISYEYLLFFIPVYSLSQPRGTRIIMIKAAFTNSKLYSLLNSLLLFWIVYRWVKNLMYCMNGWKCGWLRALFCHQSTDFFLKVHGHYSKSIPGLILHALQQSYCLWGTEPYYTKKYNFVNKMFLSIKQQVRHLLSNVFLLTGLSLWYWNVLNADVNFWGYHCCSFLGAWVNWCYWQM